MIIVILLAIATALLFMKAIDAYESFDYDSTPCMAFATFGAIVLIITLAIGAEVVTYRMPSKAEACRVQMDELHKSIVRQLNFIERAESTGDFNGIVEEYGKVSEDIYIYNSRVRAAKAKRNSVLLKDFEFRFYDELDVIEID